MELRQPVVVVLGHVDSGKTSLLDKIRGTAVQAREVGGITQHIGASFFPVETIKEITGPLYGKLAKSETPIPGLLVIDTPGHEVFANLRARGGSAADIAILVVDINKGFEPQTLESLDILRKRKVPFVVALNKVDMVMGWRSSSNFISEAVKKQEPSVETLLDEKIYNVVGTLSRLGFPSEAFWRVKEFTKEIALVPVSARSGVGIPELLAVLVGMTQQYMAKRLERHALETARGIVLEFTEATERRDFQAARGYLKNNVSYVSPLNSFDRAEPYLKYNLHLYETGQLVKFDIKKEFADSNDVCILHELNSQLVCVWYHVDDAGKISSVKVIFDPRAFLEGAKQR